MIPVFEKIIHPVLVSLKDGQCHKLPEIMKSVQMQLSISDEDALERVKSGAQTKLYNRVQWATTYLAKAGLTFRPKIGVNQITDIGLNCINQGIIVTPKYMSDHSETFKSFAQSLNTTSTDCEVESGLSSEKTSTLTPLENISANYRIIKQELVEELLEIVKQQSPIFFEHLVVDLLVKMGYGGQFDDNAFVTQFTNDEGIDGVIKEDKLGLDKIYIQAKRYKDNSVGREDIQKFVGALAGQGASKGVFITTSTFTKGALEFKPQGVKLVLIDGQQLCRYMIEFNLGVSTKEVFEIKRVDSDYFE